MRLFIAISFSDDVKKILLEAIDSIRSQASSGTFTRPENLHLTLALIGESDQVVTLEAVLDNLQASAFSITVDVFGRFGELYWAGVENCEGLRTLANDFSVSLRRHGFDIERREFKPHITLARQVKSSGEIRLSIPKTDMTVSRISLMKSERINGRLTYTELYGRMLR